MATGDIIYSPGTQTTVITGAATRATGVFSTEVTALTSNVAPFANAVLTCAYTTAPTEGDLVHLYRRDINIDGAGDATVPEDGYEHIHVGSFPVKNLGSSTTQYISLPNIPLIEGDQEFYIENDADQTMDSGYLVKITPMAFNTAA